MSKKKIAFVVAIPRTAQSFLMDHITILQNEYDVHLIANFASVQEKFPFEKVGLKCHHVNIVRSIKIKADIDAFYELRTLFISEAFDCVHSVTPKAGLLTALAGKMAGVPNRFHIFTGQVWATRKGVMRSILKGMDKIIAKLDTKLLVDGEGQRRFLIKEGVLTKQNSMVPANGSIAGIKLDRYIISEEVRNSERAKFGFSKDDVVYIFLGRLNHDKGIGELYAAFNNLVAEKANAKLLLYGTDEEECDQMVNSIRYPSIIRNKNYFFPGRTSKPFDALQAGDVFVIPTYREGFGVSVLEAQALGLPVITSDAYGVVDASVEGETGVRCKVGDVDSLLASMSYYYDNSEIRIRHGQKGRERVEKLFDNALVSKAWLDIYHENVK